MKEKKKISFELFSNAGKKSHKAQIKKYGGIKAYKASMKERGRLGVLVRKDNMLRTTKTVDN